MATEADILSVKANIPDNVEDDGWDDDRIGILLDAGLSIIKVTLAFWSSRVGKYANMVDVSEASSTRQISQLFTQAQATYQIWLDRSKLEDNPPPATRNSIRFHKLKRV